MLVWILYQKNVTTKYILHLLDPIKGIDNLKFFYSQFLDKNHLFRSKGCLMIITANEAPQHGDVINLKLTSFTKQLKQMIYDNLVINQSKDKRCQLASMLVAQTFGLLVLMRCQRIDDIIEQQIYGILQVLNNFNNKEDEYEQA